MKLEFKQESPTLVAINFPSNPRRPWDDSWGGAIILRGDAWNFEPSACCAYNLYELRQIADEMDRLSSPPSVTHPKLLRNKDTGDTQPWCGEAVIDRYELIDPPEGL